MWFARAAAGGLCQVDGSPRARRIDDPMAPHRARLWEAHGGPSPHPSALLAAGPVGDPVANILLSVGGVFNLAVSGHGFIGRKILKGFILAERCVGKLCVCPG